MSFDISRVLKSINDTKERCINTPEDEKSYIPFVISRTFSYFPDTILYANAVNEYPFLDNRLHYDYYFYAIKRRKRFSRWFKKSKEDDTIKLIMKVYKCSRKKAMEYETLLTDAQKKDMKEMYKEVS